MSALRLNHLGFWGLTSSSYAQVLNRTLAYEPLIAARVESGTHEVKIYTVGSKINEDTGAGFHSMDLNGQQWLCREETWITSVYELSLIVLPYSEPMQGATVTSSSYTTVTRHWK